MPELEDYSGPFNPDLKLEDFSKDFLLKIMRVWQYEWIELVGTWYYVIKEKLGREAANDCELAAWLSVGERVNPRYQKVANIELNTVLDSLKLIQLPLDNFTGELFRAKYDIKNENHVIVTVPNCGALRYLERNDPERIEPVCLIMEKETLERYAINPKIKITPLKLPPRKSPDEIACQWEFKLEE